MAGSERRSIRDMLFPTMLADGSPMPWARIAAWTAAGTVIALVVILSTESPLWVLLAAMAFSVGVGLVELRIAMRRGRSGRLDAR